MTASLARFFCVYYQVHCRIITTHLVQVLFSKTYQQSACQELFLSRDDLQVE